MMERKSKGARPGARGSETPSRPRTKAAEAPRDPKISAPVETSAPPTRPAPPKPTDRMPDAAKPAAPAAPSAPAPAPAMAARDAIGTVKPAPAVKAAAPAPKPATRNPAEFAAGIAATRVSPNLDMKSAPSASVQKPPTAQPAPAPRPVDAAKVDAAKVDVAKPARDLERAVRAATTGMAEAAKPAVAALATMSAAAPSVAPVAARIVEAGTENVRRTTTELRNTGETTGRLMSDTASTAARGWVEFNGKVLDVMRVQGDAAFSLWRDTVTARSFPDAMRAQTNGLQHLYETSAAQWREVAEAAARLMGDAAKPMGAIWPSRRA